MGGFYQREREYAGNGKQSISFSDVVPNKLTLRKRLNSTLLGSRQAYIVDRSSEAANGLHDTPFKEVDIAPYESTMAPMMTDIINSVPVPTQLSKEDYARKIFELFKFTIKKHWDPEKFHVITHSSGSDSRLISTAIKQLHEELGDDWLGDIIFIECEGESKEFLEIMKVQGWIDSQYAVYNDIHTGAIDPSENHWLSLEFETAWRKLNGVLGFPVNVWWDSVEWLQRQGIIPADSGEIQAWTGYGSNEVSKALYHPEQTMEWYFKWHYYHELSCFAMPCETVHPFHDLGFISEFIKWADSEKPMEFSTVTVSKKIVPFVAPELNSINRDVDKIKDAQGFRRVSKELMTGCWDDYIHSWYGQNVAPNITPTNKIEYSDWWGHWCLASFCEHLIETGHEITLEG